jgi:hypothetical protein
LQAIQLAPKIYNISANNSFHLRLGKEEEVRVRITMSVQSMTSITTQKKTFIHQENQENGLAEETTYEECYLYFMQNFMNMVIQPINQLEAEYKTITEIYDVMLTVKNGFKDHIKDKFYGFSSVV